MKHTLCRCVVCPKALKITCLTVIFLAKATADDFPGFQSVIDHSFVSELDGSRQKYVVMTPRSVAQEDFSSALIVLHGHGSDRWQFVRNARSECRAARNVAASRKMLFVSPDYRGKTSWMGPAAEADVVQIIQILKRQFKIQKVFICGGSMGGTGALTFTALHPELIHGVVALNGTANLLQYDRFQDAIAASFGGSKQDVPDEYRKRSAEFFPNRFTMPLATTTGGKDTVVPPDSLLQFVQNVRATNSSVLSIHRESGGHSTNYRDTKKALEFVLSEAATH